MTQTNRIIGYVTMVIFMTIMFFGTISTSAAIDCNNATYRSDPACATQPATTPKSSVCQGVNIASGETGTDCSTTSGTAIDKLVKQIIIIFSWVVGVVAVFAIIIAGLQFITAGGDAAKIAKARNVILYAIIGLVVVAVAQIIVIFVIGSTSNVITPPK